MRKFLSYVCRTQKPALFCCKKIHATAELSGRAIKSFKSQWLGDFQPAVGPSSGIILAWFSDIVHL